MDELFGARYYDARTSVWQSTDPALGKFLDGRAGLGGIYNSNNLGVYSYAHNNPVKLVDPDGNVVLISGHIGAWPIGYKDNPDSYHLSLVVIPDNPSDFEGEEGWQNLPNSNGHIFQTIGAQPTLGQNHTAFGNLRREPNNPDDSLANSQFTQVVSAPKGMNDTDFIRALMKTDRNYPNHLSYSPYPTINDKKFNSNSYISGILQAAGRRNVTLESNGRFQAPGFDKPIPSPNTPRGPSQGAGRSGGGTGGSGSGGAPPAWYGDGLGAAQ